MLPSTKMYRKTFNFNKRSNQNRKNGSGYTFSPNVTEEMLMNPENYDIVFHRHILILALAHRAFRGPRYSYYLSKVPPLIK